MDDEFKDVGDGDYNTGVIEDEGVTGNPLKGPYGDGEEEEEKDEEDKKKEDEEEEEVEKEEV